MWYIHVVLPQRYSSSSPSALDELRSRPSHRNRTVHSVIYHEKHIQDPLSASSDPTLPAPPGCGVGASEETKKWMDGVQTSAVEEEEDAVPDPPQPVAMPLTSADLPISGDEDASFKYTAEANRWGREFCLNWHFVGRFFG